MRQAVASGAWDGYREPDKAGCAGALRFDDKALDNVQIFEPFDATIHGTFEPEPKVHDEPESGLGRLDGLRMQGRWELQVADIDSFESQATLECFKLRITYQPAWPGCWRRGLKPAPAASRSRTCADRRPARCLARG